MSPGIFILRASRSHSVIQGSSMGAQKEPQHSQKRLDPQGNLLVFSWTSLPWITEVSYMCLCTQFEPFSIPQCTRQVNAITSVFIWHTLKEITYIYSYPPATVFLHFVLQFILKQCQYHLVSNLVLKQIPLFWFKTMCAILLYYFYISLYTTNSPSFYKIQ